MKRTTTSTEIEPDVLGPEFAFFALEAALLVASIVLVVHFRSTAAVVFAVGAIVVTCTVAAVRLRAAAPRGSGPRSTRRLRRPPQPGEYRASSRDLFRVEKVFGDRALVEDCRTGHLVDISVEELGALRVVTVRSRDREGASLSVR